MEQKDLAVLFLLQIQGHALFVAVHFHEPAGKITPPGNKVPGVIPLHRFFDLDDVCSHIRKETGTEGSGQQPGHVEYSDIR
jgi:hypothetical protein